VTKLDLLTDVTAIGAEWDDVILEMAHYIGRIWSNEYDKAKVSRDLAKEMIAELITVYDDEEKDRRERVQPDPQQLFRPTY
jgi:hypothetical protein